MLSLSQLYILLHEVMVSYNRNVAKVNVPLIMLSPPLYVTAGFVSLYLCLFT